MLSHINDFNHSLNELRGELSLTDKIIDGRRIADEIKTLIKKTIADLNIQPRLAVVNTQIDPASNYYVQSQKKQFAALGMAVEEVIIDPLSPVENFIEMITQLNQRREIHGIQAQLPLPKKLPAQKILNHIAPQKDVDCQASLSLGHVMIGGDEPVFYPNTAYAVQFIIQYYRLQIHQWQTVILNRSLVVGKPLAMMLLEKSPELNATLTVCHSQTKDLPTLLQRADLIIIAIGRARYLPAEWVKPGGCVIDVGINSIVENGKTRIVGDADFDAILPKAAAITPVPGGVGSVTTALLMSQTLKAALLQEGSR